MSSLSTKRLRNYFLAGAVIAVSYLILGRRQILIYRIIDSLFVGGIFPFVIGCFRFAKHMGSFDLLVYAHRKLWKYGKRHEKFEEENEAIAPNSTEKLGTYADYLSQKKSDTGFREPLIAGGVYCLVSLFMTIAFY